MQELGEVGKRQINGGKKIRHKWQNHEGQDHGEFDIRFHEWAFRCLEVDSFWGGGIEGNVAEVAHAEGPEEEAGRPGEF